MKNEGPTGSAAFSMCGRRRAAPPREPPGLGPDDRGLQRDDPRTRDPGRSRDKVEIVLHNKLEEPTTLHLQRDDDDSR